MSEIYSILDLSKIVKSARENSLLGLYEKALSKYNIAIPIVQSRISELINGDTLLQEKWKSIEKSLKGEVEEIKEIMKSCEVFKNIYNDSGQKRKEQKKEEYDSPPKDPYSAKIEKDADMLRRLQGIEPEKKPRKQDKNGLDADEILNNVKMVQNITNQVENKINNIQKKEKEKEQPKEKPKPIYKKIKDLHIYTHVGFDGEQDKENNQDNYFIQKNFAGHKDYIYMSVCDGHGVNGHHVSNFIKTILPVDMSENLKHRNILTETEKTHEIIKETFIIANDKLVENQNIDSIFSGTTCVSVIYTPEKLICPNIGDSRAVLARYDNDKKKYIAIELTRDHKPTELDEKRRILENDGRIQPFFEDGEFVGPERIWIKEEEVPGLAMTRSFGDRVAATVGVISEPEIKEFDLDINDKYMIIASDGIWEFISSQECIDIISSFYEKNDIKGCCQFLYEESSKRWIKEEEVIDDTTLILVFFE